ncbi:MAG: SHOCT domain-containing protein [Chloroflexota bacterium]
MPLVTVLAVSVYGLLTALTATFLVWLTRRLTGERGARDVGTKRALAILRERYAKGEINREQFEQMRREIEE